MNKSNLIKRLRAIRLMISKRDSIASIPTAVSTIPNRHLHHIRYYVVTCRLPDFEPTDVGYFLSDNEIAVYPKSPLNVSTIYEICLRQLTFLR